MPTQTDPGDVRQDSASSNPVERDGARDQQGAKPLSGNENDQLQGIEGGFGKDGSEPSHSPNSHSVAGAASGGIIGIAGPKKMTPTGALNFEMASQFAATHRGKLIGGGVVGLLITFAFAAFFASLPLKLESMMENILEKRISNRIEHYMEGRAEKGMERFLADDIGSSDALFSKSVVISGSPWASLYKTMRVRGFENSLKERSGKSFRKAPDGSIDMYQDGELVGNLSKGEAIDEFNQAISDSTHWVQFYKRLHLRNWMRQAYGITKWDFFKNVVNKIKCKVSSCSSDDAAETEGDTELVTDAEPEVVSGASDAITCGMGAISGGAGPVCVDDEGDPKNPGLEGGDPEADIPKSQTDGTQDDTVSGAATDATQAAEADTTREIAKKSTGLVSKVLTKFLGQELATKITVAFAAAKGPLIIIAGIDILSRFDHFFWYGEADKVLVNIHKVQYAAEFAEWMIIDNNWKDGKTVSGDEFNAMASKLNGTENSAASRSIYLNQGGGQSLTTVSDGSGGTVSDGDRSIDESAHPIQTWYQAHIGNIVVPPPLGFGTVHLSLGYWYNTGGKIWALINRIGSDIISVIIDIVKIANPVFAPVLSWLMTQLAHLLIKATLLLIEPAVDGTESGADLMNGLDAGGAVTGMDFARNLGAPQMSPIAGAQLDNEIAAQQSAAASQMSIATRLFSTSYPNSLINTVALETPSTPSGAISDSMGYVASITADPLKIFTPLLSLFGIGNARAATDTPAQNYGLIDWGYTDTQLSVDDTKALNEAWANAAQRLGATPTYGDLQLSDCPAPVNPNTMPNVCRLDIATIQSLGAEYTTSDDGGIGGQ